MLNSVSVYNCRVDFHNFIGNLLIFWFFKPHHLEQGYAIILAEGGHIMSFGGLLRPTSISVSLSFSCLASSLFFCCLSLCLSLGLSVSLPFPVSRTWPKLLFVRSPDAQLWTQMWNSIWAHSCALGLLANYSFGWDLDGGREGVGERQRREEMERDTATDLL